MQTFVLSSFKRIVIKRPAAVGLRLTGCVRVIVTRQTNHEKDKRTLSL